MFLAAVLWLCAGFSASALESPAEIALYFAPVTGGLPEEREFFGANLPREITGAQYRVVDSREEADLVVSVALTGHERPGNAALCTVGLIAAPNNSLLLELFWNYVDVKEMRSWGVGSLLAPDAPAAPRPRHTSLLPAGAAQRKERP